MFHLEVQPTGGMGSFWAFMEGDKIGHAGPQPVGDVLVTPSLSPQHPARLPGEQRLRFPLRVEQTQPTLRHRVAKLLQLQPAHSEAPPEDESTQLLINLLAEAGWQREDLGGVPDC